jgi:hypothetical protein
VNVVANSSTGLADMRTIAWAELPEFDPELLRPPVGRPVPATHGDVEAHGATLSTAPAKQVGKGADAKAKKRATISKAAPLPAKGKPRVTTSKSS